MPAYRFYLNEPFESKQELILKDDEFHHLKNVMRLEEGDPIEIINGTGSLALGEISSIKKKFATFLIKDVSFFERIHQIILLQGMPKIQKLELIIEKGTELGVSEIQLFLGDKSIQKLTEEKLQRLEQKSISALKQSGRYYLPKIKIVSPISSWPTSFKQAYFGDLSEEASPLLKAIPECFDLNPIYFCCGPEAGFSENEIITLKEKNFKGVSLHSNILRCETAPLVFLSLIHHKLLIQGNDSVIN